MGTYIIENFLYFGRNCEEILWNSRVECGCLHIFIKTINYNHMMENEDK